MDCYVDFDQRPNIYKVVLNVCMKNKIQISFQYKLMLKQELVLSVESSGL